MENKSDLIISEVEKAISGKKAIVKKVLMAILAGGHVLIDDVPGVGKTTIALAFSRALGLRYNRVQFTPDVMASDIVGFSIYNKNTGGFDYKPGVVSDTNLLLGDEINRAPSKTQSALLEVMEEGNVTVDGISHQIPDPFIVIATQNRVGTAGTQNLPQAQIDRFMICVQMGYPDFDSQVEIIRERKLHNPLELVNPVADAQEVLFMQERVREVTLMDSLIEYIVRLAETTRQDERIELGVSPRGALAVSRMVRARAYVEGRDYVVPEDIREVFADVCAHRILLSSAARMSQMKAEDVLKDVMDQVQVPDSLSYR